MAKWIAALFVALNIVTLIGWLVYEVLTGYTPPGWLPLACLSLFSAVCAAFIMLNPYSGLYRIVRWPGRSNIHDYPGSDKTEQEGNV